MSLYANLIKPALFALDAEKAHGLSIAGLRAGLFPRHTSHADSRLRVSVAGLTFANPLGMAAGYDKNADVPHALLKLGFGHAEIGTVTPKPQPGNDKPRIFRLPEDEGVINRLGFNSGGHQLAHTNLLANKPRGGIVGVNIGANKTSDDFAADYVTGIHAFADLADYFTVNISSPNTPGLRALQGADPLVDLLQRVDDARSETSDKHNRQFPVFLKIAPDLKEAELDDIAKALHGSSFDGLIVSNTTLSRKGLKSANREEVGGLSGKPLFERSTIVLAKMRQRMTDAFPLIGVGGVTSSETAFQKIEAGASLVQLYSGMVYGGPELPARIVTGLSTLCDREGLTSISDAVGRDCERWAGLTLD